VLRPSLLLEDVPALYFKTVLIMEVRLPLYPGSFGTTNTQPMVTAPFHFKVKILNNQVPFACGDTSGVAT
jgi:hypothetical protein